MTDLAQTLLDEARARYDAHVEGCDECKSATQSEQRCSFGAHLKRILDHRQKIAEVA